MSEILNKTIEKVLASEQAFCRFITINDTPAHGAHQSGFFIPKCAAPLLFNEAFKERDNFDRAIQINWQDDFVTESRAVYYGRKKNEYRITRLGRGFPFLADYFHDCPIGV